jgi:glycosyltransferase involved in cell wall biosynthesis/SAM-dependent methyltransferase
MRICFLTHYFPPEVGAPQTRILESARLLLQQGHDVTVLTGFPNYPDGVVPRPYRGRLFMRETVAGVPTLRTAIFPAPNAGMLRRLVNHASFAMSAVAAAGQLPATDVLIAESPPLATAAAGVMIARRQGIPLVLNVADLWPESAVQLGVVSSPRVIAVAKAVEQFAYRHAAAVLVPVEGMRDTLLGEGWGAQKVVTLPNAVDLDRFAVAHADRPEIRQEDSTTVMYCGTVGLAQSVETLVAAAAELRDSGDEVNTVIVGDGAERARLESLAQSLGLDRVSFRGRIPRDEVPAAIAAADITAVTLRDVPLFRAARPTKVLEYMAAGKPVVASAAGDVVELLSAAGAGIACSPESPRELAEAIRALHRDRAEARRLGNNGRTYVEKHLGRRRQTEELERVLREVTEAPDESARVGRVYQGYASSTGKRDRWSASNPGNRQILRALYEGIEGEIRRAGVWPERHGSLIEVGCGHGAVLRELADRGVPEERLYGVDILAPRARAAREALPGAHIHEGNARSLPFEDSSFDVAVLSTVLSSVLNRELRRAITAEILRVLRPGGVVLCYDARTPNPFNRAVRAVSRRELRSTFPGEVLCDRSLTLLPPAARRLGRVAPVAYPLLAGLRPLRTHRLFVVRP